MNRFTFSFAAIAIGILSACGSSGPAATPSPAPSSAATASPSPTQAATASPASTSAASQLTEGSVEPGRYFVDFGDYRYTVTVSDFGWLGQRSGGGGLYRGDDSELAVFWFAADETNLYRRACDSFGTEFAPGPSVDDLADALASLEDFETTEPADVAVSGFEGKRVAVTVPMDVDVRSSACDGSEYSLSPQRHFQAPGQTDDMLALDVDGGRQVVVLSWTPGTPTDVAAQLNEMLASLEIDPL